MDRASGMRTIKRTAISDKGHVLPTSEMSSHLISPSVFLQRTVRALCFGERTLWFSCAAFGIGAVGREVCAKRLSAPTQLERRWGGKGEVELCPKLHAFSLPSKSSENLSFSSSASACLFCLCFYHLLLTPEPGNVVAVCPRVILEMLKRQQSSFPDWSPSNSIPSRAQGISLSN